VPKKKSRAASNVSKSSNGKKGKKAESEDEEEEEDGDKEIFVGNLAFSVVEDALYDLFAKYGEVTNVKLPTRPDGTSKGIAFVEFSTRGEAKKAIAGQNGKSLEGRNLKVNFSSEKPTFDNAGPPRGGDG